MGIFHHAGGSNKLMMQSLIPGLHIVGNLCDRSGVAFYSSSRQHRTEGHSTGIDFVEGQPVFHLVLVPLENGLTVGLKIADDLPALPAITLFHQGIGQFIMGDGDQRLDSVLFAAVEDLVKVSQLITGIALGIATGIQSIFGFNYGSGQHDRVKKTYKLALTSCTLILVAAFFIFQFCPEYIINLFGQESDLYMEFAVKCFRVYLLACFMIGAGAVTGIFFQAIGRPIPAALLSLSRQILFLIPAMLLFGYLWGVEGILWAGPVGDGLSGVISLMTLGAFWKKIFNKEVAEK